MRVFFWDNYDFGKCTGKMDYIKKSPVLLSHDIEVTENPTQCDVIICNGIDAEILAIAEVNVLTSIVILERYDSSILGKSNNFVSLQSVIGVFKDFTLVNNITNIPMVENRYHYTLCGLHVPKKEIKYQRVTDDEYDKVKCVPWALSQYSHLTTKSDMLFASKLVDQKTIDIFYVVHPHEHSKYLGHHRKRIKEIVSSFSDDFRVVVENIENKHEYMETLKKSRVVVCPFGLGERIAADQFTIWSGGVLVKADCSFMQTFPNIYTDEYCTFFNPDCSDLESVLSDVLDNYEFYHKRTLDARRMFQEYNNEDVFVNHFCRELTACWNSNTL